MVTYYGHNSAKMFICSKITRFWFKAWFLSFSDEYLLSINKYCEEGTNTDNKYSLWISSNHFRQQNA